MKYILIIVFGLGTVNGFAQQSIPIFTSKKDSAEYSQVQAALQLLFKAEESPSKAKQLDSLFKLQAAFRDRIIGYRTIFYPDKTFTSYSDLNEGKIDPLTITKLSVANTRVSKLPSKIYLCENLQELELVNTSVKKLSRKLSKLPKLKSVYVYNNRTNHSLKLGKNKQTKELLLRGMEAKSLPKKYKNFAALEDLNLARNIGLASFPNIYQNKSLKKLTLLENQITLNDLKPITHSTLEELNLQKNKISTVPDAIGSFANLKKITFNYNQISVVKPGIGNLQKMEEISFYQNNLTTVPEGVYNLPNLKSVDLYHNQIGRIESAIVKLKNLEILYLSNNQLTTLPDNLGEMYQLRELYLSNNKLFTLPVSLKNLKHLTIFRVNKNKLTDFPEFVLDLPSIENIDISSNNIRVIPSKITGLPNLNIFVLGDNPISKEEVDISKLVQALTEKGTIVHQNYVEVMGKTDTP